MMEYPKLTKDNIKYHEDKLINFSEFGYKCWQTDHNDMGRTEKWQVRVDNQERFKDVPLCETNDKVHLNIDAGYLLINGEGYTNYTFSITQEANEIWCDLKLYSISEDDIMKIGLDEFEKRMVELWKCNYFLHYTV